MKKLISLLLAGVAIVALSGCSDKVGEPESVDINNLDRGYLVTGVDGVIEPVGTLDITPQQPVPGPENEIVSIQFCPNDNAEVLWRDGNTSSEAYSIEGTDLLFTHFYIYTDDDGTPGRLVAGTTYTIVNKNTEWTIADIQITLEGCP